MIPRRGTETRQRTVVLTARFNAQEAEAVRQLAKKRGQPVSALLRETLLNVRAPRPRTDQRAIARVLGQLGKIGSNINQLAYYAHTGRLQEQSIEAALRDLSELRLSCLQALGREPREDHPAEDSTADTASEDES